MTPRARRKKAEGAGKFPGGNNSLLRLVKDAGSATIAELAEKLSVTREAVRQQVVRMKAEGWLRESVERSPRAGRPTHRYTLTPAGEHAFPKAYDALAVELLDRTAERLGPAALEDLLAGMTEARVQAWAPKLAGKNLRQRLALLKGLYVEEDGFMSVEGSGRELRLVERNCPFMNVAARRPALCSVTVSALSRLLGHQVRREESFQAGHGRCVFRVMTDSPLPPRFRFQLEPPLPGITPPPVP